MAGGGGSVKSVFCNRSGFVKGEARFDSQVKDYARVDRA